MKTQDPSKIRTLVIAGHQGAGKTSLVDAILHKTGVNDRHGSVDNGSSAADVNDNEIQRKTTIYAKPFHVPWKDCEIYLIDTPGYADFFGEVVSSLRVADGLLLVVDAFSGPEVGTLRAWKLAEERNLPRAIVINRLDKEHTDFDRVLESVRKVFGHRCVPVILPDGSAEAFQAVASVLQGAEAAPEAIRDRVAEARSQLVESAAESDDALMEKYFEEGDLSPEEFAAGLRTGVNAASFVPIFVTAASKMTGIEELLDGIVDLFPSPVDRGEVEAEPEPVSPDPSGPLCAFVFKTVVDPFVGQLSYMRIYSGTMKADSEYVNHSRGQKERLGTLYVMNGKKQETVGAAVPGDIIAVAKLKGTRVNDTIGEASKKIVIPPIRFPNPTISYAVKPRSQGDEEKVASGLARLADEDPTLVLQRNDETKQLLLCGMGDLHIEVAIERLRQTGNVEVDLTTPKVPYHETATVPAEGHYRHKKQTGGHGQFGEVYLRIEPLERDAGFEFANEVVGGNIPRQFILAVEKGVVEAMERGSIAGYPVCDVKVTVYDGKHHPVDSSEMSFKIASRGAFRDAMEKAKPVLLEPIGSYTVTVPEEYMGDITGDLNAKRGRILGMDSSEGMQVIHAQVPMAEMFRYSTELRSLTGGRGTFTVEPSHYEVVPANIAQKIAEEARKEREGEGG